MHSNETVFCDTEAVKVSLWPWLSLGAQLLAATIGATGNVLLAATMWNAPTVPVRSSKDILTFHLTFLQHNVRLLLNAHACSLAGYSLVGAWLGGNMLYALIVDVGHVCYGVFIQT